jgi:tetratricopeptide (TPR) repeat protein
MFISYEFQLDDDDMSEYDHASDMEALGLAATRAKEPAWAIRYLTKAIELGYPGHVIWAERSTCYVALHEYDEAFEDALVCIRLNPLCGIGFARKGEALMAKGLLNAAETAFMDGLQVNPDLPILLKGIAELRHRRLVAVYGDKVQLYPRPFITLTWNSASAPTTNPTPISSAITSNARAQPLWAIEAPGATHSNSSAQHYTSNDGTPLSSARATHKSVDSSVKVPKEHTQQQHTQQQQQQQHTQQQHIQQMLPRDRRYSIDSADCGRNPESTCMSRTDGKSRRSRGFNIAVYI